MPHSRGSSSAPTGRSRRRGRLVVVLLAVASLALAACGGDDSDEDSSAAEGGTSAGGEKAVAPTGAPIKVMTVAPVNTQLPPYPNIPAAAEVYEQYINAKGGINGRPLELITCDDRGDPNEGANCARRAVDEEVVAVVGSFVFDASRIIPVLEQGKIAWFGECCPLVAQEFTSPISFPIGSLFPGQGAGVAWKMAKDGCKTPAYVVLDIPAGEVGLPAFRNAFQVGGGDPSKVKVVKISPTAQDYSPQVAEATGGGVDCVYGGISDSNWAAWLPASEAAGADQRLYGLQGNLNSKIVEQFPDITDGAVVSNSYPNIERDMWEDYRNALEEYDAPDLDWNSLAGLGTWTAYTAFTEIVSGISGEVTGQSFLDAASRTTSLDTGGMIPVIDLTKTYTGFGGTLPRIFNRTVFFDVAKDGKLEPLDDKSYDMTGPIDGKQM
jgi:ABC-type branched-subunit amino acid transport system substrate-binding protein